MFTKISHITLFVSNQDKALDFYQKLGFIVHTDAEYGPMRWLTVCLPEQKDIELVIMLAETEVEKALVGKQAGDKPFLSLETSDCKGDYEKLSATGVKFLEKPKEEPWGISAALQDPYGNLIYICETAATESCDSCCC